MNYYKIYCGLIEKAKRRYTKSKYLTYKENAGIYLESHHIVPKYKNGNDDKSNLVLLTAKEHYVAHHLLYKIDSGNSKAALAFHRMWNVTMSKRYVYKLTSSQYESLRKLHSENARKSATGRKCSEHSKQVASKTHKGKTISDEHKKAVSNYSKNKNQTHIRNLSIMLSKLNSKPCVYNGVTYTSATMAYSLITDYKKSANSFRRDLLNEKYTNMYYL